MIRIRRRISGFLTISALAVIAGVAAALFGLSPAQAHTTTAVLLPTADGTYTTGWGTNNFDELDEGDPTNCTAGDAVTTGTTGNRESVQVSLASIPDGATITSVSVQSWHVGSGGTGGTYQTFARIGGTDTDSGTNIATTSNSGCTAATAQSLNVADTVKSGSTVLEVGVLKTITNTNTVRVGALRATVEYNRDPSTPSLLTPANGATTTDKTPTFDWNDSSDPDGSDVLTYQIGRAPQVSGTCDWGSGTTDVASSSTFTPGSDMSLGTHCWRVRAVDHGSLISSFSTERTFTIVQPAVTAEITAADKEYDGDADAEYTCDVVGEESGDDVTCDGDPATFDTATVGTGKTVTANGLSLSGPDAGSYTLTNTSDTDTADISKATLSVSADVQSKDYGDDDPTLTYSLTGFVNGETALTAAISGSADCSRDPGESPADSPYLISCTPGTLAATNYTFLAGDTNQLTIGLADPVCTIDGFSGTYDGSSHGATGTCEGVDGEGTLAGLDLGDSFTTVPGGTAEWTFTDQTGNYNEASGTAEIVIDPATLSIDADDQTKDFGDDDPELSYDLSGFVNGENETSADVTGDAACDRVEGETVAGSPYIITCEPGTLSADNYTFEAGTIGNLTIEAVEVSAEITADNKDYDGTTDATYTCDVVGESAGDDVTCDGDPASFGSATAGDGKTLTASGLTLGGADAGNYTLSNTTDDDTANIAKVVLSVDADDASKAYGATDPTFTYTLTGFVAGEDASNADGLTGAANCTRDAGDSVAGSPYEITCTTGDLAADNYTFEAGESGELTITKADPNCLISGFAGTYDGDSHGAIGTCTGINDEGPLDGLVLGDSFTDVPGGTANWTFTDETGNYDDDSGSENIVIDAAIVEVDADNQTKAFGDDDPALTYTLDGFVDGEDETSAGVTGEGSCTRDPGETVAGSPYAITCEPDTLAAANYTFVAGDPAELTIGAGEVSAEITATDKDYDGTTDAEYTCDVVGADSGDDVTCDGTHPAAFDDANAGTAKTVTASDLVLSGDDAGDYSLSNTTDTDEADIAKATLSVDADDASKDYGDDNPTLSYTLTGFVNDETALTAAGFTGAGDCTRAPGQTVAGSPYEITCTPGTLAADNYDFETGETGEFTINQATVSVDAEDQSKTFGDDDPALTYTLSGFADGEDETSAGVTGDASCTRAGGETVAGSPYDITCTPGTLAADNYTFETGEIGELTIEGAEVSAEITAENKAYDGLVDAVYTCDVVGEVSDDDVTCDGDHPATFDDANAGTDKTVTATNLELSGADAGNYTLGNLSDTDEADITAATLTVNADDATKSFGDDDPTFTYTLSGFVAPDTELTAGITGAGECTRAEGESVAGSPYVITCTPGDLEADNYTFETGETGELTITPDTTVPSVTIEQALSQDDPTSDSPIVFDVVFSEEVTGFGDDDVDLSAGTAAGASASVSGDGAEYTVTVSGMTSDGTVIATVEAAAATDGTNDSTASTSEDNTVTYSLKTFDPGPTATISGTPRVGDTLTAGAGGPLPTPDDFEYQWFANGDPIAGADDETFTPTSAEVGKVITVKVTAVKAGYADASDTSDPTGPVGTLPAKSIQVTTNGGAAFAGDRISISVLRLQPHEAYTVRFDGDVVKTGTANLLGNANFTMLVPLTKQPGSYTVEAVGSLPDRKATDTLEVKTPKTLGVTLSKASVAAGGSQRVTVTNLLNDEKVEIRYDGTLVSPSTAMGNSAGGYALTFPVGATVGSHSVEVKGTYNGRTTSKTFTVTGP